MSIRVFLIDDHDVVRIGLKELLTSEGMNIVGESDHASGALEEIVATSPDIAVVDARLPDQSGIDLCRDIRSVCPATECIIFTGFDDDAALANAVLAGAKAFVIKQIKGNELVEAIKRVNKGEDLISPMARQLSTERLTANHDDKFGLLSEQERRLLDLIGEGLSNRQIAERMFLGEKTVKNYVSNLLAKLGMSRRTEAAIYAVKRKMSGA